MHRNGTARAISAAMEGSTKLRGRCFLTRTPCHWRAALLLVASILGCNGLVGSGPSQPPPSDITVTVAPNAASILLGETRTFTATVSNTTDTAVTWAVNEIPGGNAAVGTIDAGGVYTAPQILPAPPSVSLTATSVADPSKKGAATITVTSSFSLAVTGPSSVTAGDNAAYTATLTLPANSNPSRVIFWSIAGTGCTGAACGTVDSSDIRHRKSPFPRAFQRLMGDPSKSATGTPRSSSFSARRARVRRSPSNPPMRRRRRRPPSNPGPLRDFLTSRELATARPNSSGRRVFRAFDSAFRRDGGRSAWA